jgi:quinol monooxygenase YgiN
MLHVLATIDLEPGKRAEFLTHIAWLVPLVCAEEGCIEYGAALDLPTPISVQATERPDTVMVIEKWESLSHLQDHLKAPHMVTYRERVVGLVKRVSLQILKPA